MQLKSITKEKIALTLKLCNAQVEGAIVSCQQIFKIRELTDNVQKHKRKYDEMMEELTIFKEKEKEEVLWKKEEASREALTTVMSALFS